MRYTPCFLCVIQGSVLAEACRNGVLHGRIIVVFTGVQHLAHVPTRTMTFYATQHGSGGVAAGSSSGGSGFDAMVPPFPPIRRSPSNNS